ncbi:lyase family protein [Lyticum sinuosum]|uniref:Argininosuccinate lyase 1 n=1 Tax=Lyticum sinuosum TaxID=1332059 RepID=A0AAE4VKT5_9RICK|nr:lyase family protein [Lyticum sinuosum]MDZ5761420.1 Argininosuccinate lyase 1 [Lyticum sinuosum]
MKIRNTNIQEKNFNLINDLGTKREEKNENNKNNLSSIRLYHNFIKIFEARLKMLRKAGFLQSNINVYDRIKSALGILASKTYSEIQKENLSNYSDINSYIIEQVIALTDPQTAEYLLLNYSKKEQNNIASRMWIREATHRIMEIMRSIIIQIASQAESNLKISIPGQINNQDILPVSLGYYMISYAMSFYRFYYKFSLFKQEHNEMPSGSGSMGGTSLVMNSNIIARYLHFSNVKRNAADAFGDDSHISDFINASNGLATKIGKIMRQISFWSQQYNAFIYFIKSHSSNSSFGQSNNDAMELIDSIISKSIGICNISNNVNNILVNAACPLTINHQELNANLFKCFDDLEYMLLATQDIFFIIKANKRLTKEAAQNPKSFYKDILEWFLKNTELGLHKSIEVTNSIINKAIENDQKIGLMDLQELQKINPNINAGIYAAVSPMRASIARRSIDGTSPVKVRKLIRFLIRKMNQDTNDNLNDNNTSDRIDTKLINEAGNIN